MGICEMEKNEVNYGGFWARVIAFMIDLVILGTVCMIPVVLVVLADRFPEIFFLTPIVWFGALFYFPVMESSKWQGTVGKKLLNLKVVDKDGNRLSVFRSLLRSAVKYLSFNITIGLISVLIPCSKDKRALHDSLSGTYVVAG